MTNGPGTGSREVWEVWERAVGEAARHRVPHKLCRWTAHVERAGWVVTAGGNQVGGGGGSWLAVCALCALVNGNIRSDSTGKKWSLMNCFSVTGSCLLEGGRAWNAAATSSGDCLSGISLWVNGSGGAWMRMRMGDILKCDQTTARHRGCTYTMVLLS